VHNGGDLHGGRLQKRRRTTVDSDGRIVLVSIVHIGGFGFEIRESRFRFRSRRVRVCRTITHLPTTTIIIFIPFLIIRIHITNLASILMSKIAFKSTADVVLVRIHPYHIPHHHSAACRDSYDLSYREPLARLNVVEVGGCQVRCILDLDSDPLPPRPRREGQYGVPLYDRGRYGSRRRRRQRRGEDPGKGGEGG